MFQKDRISNVPIGRDAAKDITLMLLYLDSVMLDAGIFSTISDLLLILKLNIEQKIVKELLNRVPNAILSP